MLKSTNSSPNRNVRTAEMIGKKTDTAIIVKIIRIFAL